MRPAKLLLSRRPGWQNTALGRRSGSPRGGMEPREGGPDREERVYPWWWVLPLQPYALRETVREELVPGWMWGFEQAHGAIDIVVNIRMTVVRMSGGGLWVHAPVAPTQQCLRLLRELEREFGPVKHIVHPTYAVEHKVFVGPFARACREADVWVAPGQWSFPLQLPMSMLGVFPKRVNVIGRDRALWTGEFVPKALSLPLRGAGPFVEVAFVHRATRTLLVTDTLVCPQPAPPRVCTSDPLPLLLIARDSPEQPVEDGGDKRLEGWMKTALLALYLSHPSSTTPSCVGLADTGPNLNARSNNVAHVDSTGGRREPVP